MVREELRDPRMLGLVSITRVDVSPDLRRASAYVSVFGTDEERDSTMTALRNARTFVRRELSRRLNLRYTPDVTFVSDSSIADAQRLTDVMRQTAEERGEAL